MSDTDDVPVPDPDGPSERTGDGHGTTVVDVEARPVSVVVPTARESTPTLDAVADDGGVDLHVRRDEGLNRARNAGVREATHDAVVLLDDDLAFSQEWFDDLARRVRANGDTVYTARGTGILPEVDWPDGFTPGMGRVMGFQRATWQAAGGFPAPCAHGGDTDFLLSAHESGRDVVGIDHDWEHRDDEVDQYSLRDNLRWLWFLLRRHPRLVAPRLPALLATKAGMRR
jgi:glycosyltransferase involved in cell wall biosynthesis